MMLPLKERVMTRRTPRSWTGGGMRRTSTSFPRVHGGSTELGRKGRREAREEMGRVIDSSLAELIPIAIDTRKLMSAWRIGNRENKFGMSGLQSHQAIFKLNLPLHPFYSGVVSLKWWYIIKCESENYTQESKSPIPPNASRQPSSTIPQHNTRTSSASQCVPSP
jgi:hypothetical protein